MTPVRMATPAPREAWEEVYRADPHALVYQSPLWTDFLCSFGGFEDASRLYRLDDGRTLVLPMVRRAFLGAPVYEASFPPAWGMGGLLASDGLRHSDLGIVWSELAARRAVRVSLRPNPLTAELWEAERPRGAIVVPRLAHILDLSGGFDHVWKKSFAGTARTAVRKAERANVTVEVDTTGRLVPTFYGLFERSLERWAHQQHEPHVLARWRGHRRDPLAKLQRMAAALGERCQVWVARVDGRPAASILVLRDASANYTRGAMDKELAGPTRANYLLQRLAIEDACSAGCRHYHMGETGESRSLAQFKTRFGAQPYSYAEYHLERVPLLALDRTARAAVKRLIGFRDVPEDARPAGGSRD